MDVALKENTAVSPRLSVGKSQSELLLTGMAAKSGNSRTQSLRNLSSSSDLILYDYGESREQERKEKRKKGPQEAGVD